ncbi:MAG: DUF6364 family protein [Opitutales bacterium]
MQTKLTLRVEAALVRKAKLLAKKRGTSVSRIFAEYISKQTENLPLEELPPVTASMLGVVNQPGAKVDESDYLEHLEERYL